MLANYIGRGGGRRYTQHDNSEINSLRNSELKCRIWEFKAHSKYAGRGMKARHEKGALNVINEMTVFLGYLHLCTSSERNADQARSNAAISLRKRKWTPVWLHCLRPHLEVSSSNYGVHL